MRNEITISSIGNGISTVDSIPADLKLGLARGTFILVFDTKLRVGDMITYDKRNGYLSIVTEEAKMYSFEDSGSIINHYSHVCKLINSSLGGYIPIENLVSGNKWWIITPTTEYFV